MFQSGSHQTVKEQPPAVLLDLPQLQSDPGATEAGPQTAAGLSPFCLVAG